MTVLSPDLRRQCEDGIRAIFAGDERRMRMELRLFRLICEIGEVQPTKGLGRLRCLGAIKDGISNMKAP